MKRVIILLSLLWLLPMSVLSQSDYLNNAKRAMANGDCSKAKTNYDIYIQLGGAKVSQLEQYVASCKNQEVAKTYEIGDEIDGYKICYLEPDKQHGLVYMIRSEWRSWTEIRKEWVKDGWRYPNVDELRSIYWYKRKLLRLNKIYYSSEVVRRNSNGRPIKIRAMDFRTGKLKGLSANKIYTDTEVILIKNF